MNGKPDDVPQWAWDKAAKCIEDAQVPIGDYEDVTAFSPYKCAISITQELISLKEKTNDA